jgi:hypothetical protein
LCRFGLASYQVRPIPQETFAAMLSITLERELEFGLEDICYHWPNWLEYR